MTTSTEQVISSDMQTTGEAQPIQSDTSAVAPQQSLISEPAQVAEAPVIQQNGGSLKDLLSAELSGQKGLENFKDVNDLAKSYLHAQQLIGKRIKDMSPEDLQAYHSIMGVPKEKNEYVLPAEGKPELIDWYKDVAHKAGLTQKQAKDVIDSYIMLERSMSEESARAVQHRTEQQIAELKQEFGPAFDKRIEIARRAVRSFGGEELVQVLNETGLGNNPTVVKMFAKIGHELLEDTVVGADKATTFGVTPAEAKAEINMKLSQPEFREAYFSPMHPNHKSSVEELTRLYELAHGGQG